MVLDFAEGAMEGRDDIYGSGQLDVGSHGIHISLNRSYVEV